MEPTSPEYKLLYAAQMSQYVGKKCEHCGHEYSSIADLEERRPKRGYGDDFTFVDSACWDAYMAVPL